MVAEPGDHARCSIDSSLIIWYTLCLNLSFSNNSRNAIQTISFIFLMDERIANQDGVISSRASLLLKNWMILNWGGELPQRQ